MPCLLSRCGSAENCHAGKLERTAHPPSATRLAMRSAKASAPARAQALHGALIVPGLPVLAQLRLRQYAADRDAEGDDAREHLRHVFGGRVGHAPGAGAVHPSLVLPRQQADRGALRALVVLEGDAAMDMDDLVVPRRHVPVMLRLARIEVGRDVAVLAAEDDQHLLTLRDQAMHVVGERDMPDERAVGAGQEGKVVGDQPCVRLRHDAGQRRRRDHRGDLGLVDLLEMLGQIHPHLRNGRPRFRRRQSA